MADKKPFSLPETLEGLTSEELTQLRSDARAEIDEINAVEGDLTVEQLDRLEALLSDIDTIDAREAVVAEEAEALAQRQAAARERVAGLDVAAEAEAEVVETPAEEVEAVEEVVVEAEVEPEPVLAAGTRRPTVAAAKSKAPKPVAPAPKEVEPVSLVSITASANVPQFTAGQELTDMGQLTEAFLQRVQSFGGSNPKDMKPGVYKMSPRASKFGVANLCDNQHLPHRYLLTDGHSCPSSASEWNRCNQSLADEWNSSCGRRLQG